MVTDIYSPDSFRRREIHLICHYYLNYYLKIIYPGVRDLSLKNFLKKFSQIYRKERHFKTYFRVKQILVSEENLATFFYRTPKYADPTKYYLINRIAYVVKSLKTAQMFLVWSALRYLSLRKENAVFIKYPLKYFFLCLVKIKK